MNNALPQPVKKPFNSREIIAAPSSTGPARTPGKAFVDRSVASRRGGGVAANSGRHVRPSCLVLDDGYSDFNWPAGQNENGSDDRPVRGMHSPVNDSRLSRVANSDKVQNPGHLQPESGIWRFHATAAEAGSLTTAAATAASRIQRSAIGRTGPTESGSTAATIQETSTATAISPMPVETWKVDSPTRRQWRSVRSLDGRLSPWMAHRGVAQIAARLAHTQQVAGASPAPANASDSVLPDLSFPPAQAAEARPAVPPSGGRAVSYRGRDGTAHHEDTKTQRTTRQPRQGVVA